MTTVMWTPGHAHVRMVNDAKVLGSMVASNGLVVVIDKVLLPPGN